MRPATAVRNLQSDLKDVDPAIQFWTITPHDSTQINPVPRTLLVTVTGNVVCEDYFGHTVTFAAVPAYTELPIRPKLVKSTGTTATVVGLA